MMVRITLNMHAQLSSGDIYILFGLSLHLIPYFVHASSEGSGETAHMRWLVWALAACKYDKYPKRIFLLYSLGRGSPGRPRHAYAHQIALIRLMTR